MKHFTQYDYTLIIESLTHEMSKHSQCSHTIKEESFFCEHCSTECATCGIPSPCEKEIRLKRIIEIVSLEMPTPRIPKHWGN